MSDSPQIEERIRAALANAASRNQSLRRPKFNRLMQFKEQIAELRKQDASFETIEKILCNNSFSVSHETIRVFYRRVIEGKPVRRRCHRKPANRATRPKIAKRPKTWSIGEPRIARVQDL